MTYLAMAKGDRLAFPNPASSLLTWMRTFTVSMGWMTLEAILPERDPMMKGWSFWRRVVCLGCLGFDMMDTNIYYDDSQ